MSTVYKCNRIRIQSHCQHYTNVQVYSHICQHYAGVSKSTVTFVKSIQVLVCRHVCQLYTSFSVQSRLSTV